MSHDYLTLAMSDGTSLEYGLILPENYSADQAYPAIFAPPPGPQTREMTELVLSRWSAEFQRDGWIVVSPVAPEGVMFFNGSEKYIPELLNAVRSAHKIKENRFSILGVSNGGITAFRAATLHPEMFTCILSAPGFARKADFERLEKLGGTRPIPVHMIVGEHDGSWVPSGRRTADEINRLGGKAVIDVREGEEHYVARSLGFEEITGHLRKG